MSAKGYVPTMEALRLDLDDEEYLRYIRECIARAKLRIKSGKDK